MGGQPPELVVFVLLLFWRKRGEVFVEEGLNALRIRAELKIRNCGFEIVLAVWTGVGLLVDHLVNLVVGAQRRKHAVHRRHLALVYHAAPVEADEVAYTQERKQGFGRRVRIRSGDARNDGGERGIVVVTQDVDQNSVKKIGRLLAELEQPVLERHQHGLKRVGSNRHATVESPTAGH